MLQAKGAVLEGSIPVSLGQVPRVARFRKKAEVGQAELFDKCAVFPKKRPGVGFMEAGVDKQEKKEQYVPCQVKEKIIGFSHEINSDFSPWEMSAP